MRNGSRIHFGQLTALDVYPTRPKTPQQWLSRLSVNDWLLLAYLLYLDLAVYTSEVRNSARTEGLLVLTSLLIGFVFLVLVLVRGGILRVPLLTALAYRIGHFGVLLGSYSAMRGFLPVVNSGQIDGLLHEFDKALFGLEPAVALQSVVSPLTTEWFAFFYYSYFFLLSLHALPILFVGKNARMVAEFALGLSLVIAVGQGSYLLAPGFGPSAGAPELFSTPLPTGIWWEQVLKIVEAGGAQKDIFPSVHTAAPAFILLFSYRNRRHAPFRYTWPLLSFFVGNIIIATMFLRWHWLADVVAGLGLAFSAHVASVAISNWETQHRNRRGIGAVWPPWPTMSWLGLSPPPAETSRSNVQ